MASRLLDWPAALDSSHLAGPCARPFSCPATATRQSHGLALTELPLQMLYALGASLKEIGDCRIVLRLAGLSQRFSPQLNLDG
jgi:hypothetical protein